MNNVLHDYDIFPKVIAVGKETEITIKPLGRHARRNYDPYPIVLQIRGLEDGSYGDYPARGNNVNIEPQVDEEGVIRFTYTFPKEQEYFIRLTQKEGGWRFAQLNVYAVDEDLCGRYPFVGDLHMHSCRSDGREDGVVVFANYRKHGYDFLALTDHERYYPSLEVINAYKDLNTDYELIPGEEVHIPGTEDDLRNDIHIVNFGGSFSVNGLVKESAQSRDRGEDKAWRSLDGVCPDPVSIEELKETVLAMAEELDIPEGIEKYTYAMCVWIFNQIRAGGGLGLYCHPYWISDMYQVPETLNDYILKQKPFDAFEVLGGEDYYEQNGLQTQKYYDLRAQGYDFPIVGTTDSHGSVNNRNAFVASTMVFSPANERESLIGSIKNGYSVAIDGISKEFRLVGDFRLSKYACFLLKNFFPLHDDLCYEEGRAMKDYVFGDEKAKEILDLVGPRMKAQREKYFAF